MSSGDALNLKELGIGKLIQMLERKLAQMKESDQWVDTIIKEQNTAHLGKAKEIAVATERKLLMSILDSISELSKFLDDIVLLQNLFDKTYAPLKEEQVLARKTYAPNISKYENVSKRPLSEVSKFSDLMFAISVYLGPYKEFVDAVGAECKKANVNVVEYKASSKQIERAFYKAFYVYRGDYQQMTDILRCSFVFDNFNDLYKTFTIIEKLSNESKYNMEGGILRAKDRFDPKTVPFGYRDMLINCYIPGSKIVCEIQLHHQAFFSRKGTSHYLYKRARLFEDSVTGVNFAYEYAEAHVRPKLGNDRVYEIKEGEEEEGEGHHAPTVKVPTFKALLTEWDMADYADAFENEGWVDENDWEIFVDDSDKDAAQILGQLIPKKPHQLKFKRLLKAWLITQKAQKDLPKETEEKTESTPTPGKPEEPPLDLAQYFVTQKQYNSYINLGSPMVKFGYKDEPAEGPNKHWFNFSFMAFENKPREAKYEVKKIELAEGCGEGVFYAFTKPYPELGVTEEICIFQPALVMAARFMQKGQDGKFYMRSDSNNFWGFRVRDTFWAKVNHLLIPNTHYFVTHNASKKESHVQPHEPFVKNGFSAKAADNVLFYPFSFVAFQPSEKPALGRSGELKQVTVDKETFWGFSRAIEDYIDEIVVLTNKSKQKWMLPAAMYRMSIKEISSDWTQEQSFYSRVRSDLIPSTSFHATHTPWKSFVQMHHPYMKSGFSHFPIESHVQWFPYYWVAYEKEPPLIKDLTKIKLTNASGGVEFWAFKEPVKYMDDLHEIVVWSASEDRRWLCPGEFLDGVSRTSYCGWTYLGSFWAYSAHPKY